MVMHTITAMFETRSGADQAASQIRANKALGVTEVKVLPDASETTTTETTYRESTGFLASLRNFFMPEEDRYGYAEGMRRGGYMVAVEADQAHGHEIMDMLEQAGAVDLDAQEAEWRKEGWRGFEPGSGASAVDPAASGTAGTALPVGWAATPVSDPTTTTPVARDTERAGFTDRPTATTGATPVRDEIGRTAETEARTASGTGTEERIPLAEEHLRVGKRQVIEGRVRIRSYVVETPVEETVRLRDEHVDVERRPVDRPVTGDADPFRERTLEATETREEPVVSKDTRVREELVMRRTADERDETVRDTVRRTEVSEDRGDDAATTRNPAATPKP